MKLEINGESTIIPAAVTVSELLGNLGLNSHYVAVQINRRIIRRQDWARMTVCDGDQIEIARFGSGG